MKKRRLKKSAIVFLFLVFLIIVLVVCLFIFKPWKKKGNGPNPGTKEKYDASKYYHEFAKIKEDTKLYNGDLF